MANCKLRWILERILTMYTCPIAKLEAMKVATCQPATWKKLDCKSKIFWKSQCISNTSLVRIYIQFVCHISLLSCTFNEIPLYLLFVHTILGSIEREEIPNVIAEKKQRARISTGDGTGLVSSTLVLNTTCSFSFFFYKTNLELFDFYFIFSF